MRLIKPISSIVLLACVGMLLPIAAMAQKEAPKAKQNAKKQGHERPLSFWMEKKMEYTQDILRGLVSGDLQEVADKAEQMRVVSKVEGWIRGKKSGYRTQLQVFEFANNEILRQARGENLEGTTMAFQQLTAACVSCHKTIRETNGHPAEAAEKTKSAD